MNQFREKCGRMDRLTEVNSYDPSGMLGIQNVVTLHRKISAGKIGISEYLLMTMHVTGHPKLTWNHRTHPVKNRGSNISEKNNESISRKCITDELTDWQTWIYRILSANRGSKISPLGYLPIFGPFFGENENFAEKWHHGQFITFNVP